VRPGDLDNSTSLIARMLNLSGSCFPRSDGLGSPRTAALEETMKWFRWANLALGTAAAATPVAHVLERPNKLSLDKDLWLAVQQHLYRGWGPFLGGPAEIGALASSFLLAYLRRKISGSLWPTLIASAGYAGMIVVFFTMNAPVNDDVSRWTKATVPLDWTSYRMRWESGHAIAALLSVVSLAALIRAFVKEQQFGDGP
jgi:Domain of unknown function (DUF1772)